MMGGRQAVVFAMQLLLLRAHLAVAHCALLFT